MPYRAKKPCRHFGCPHLTEGAYCAIHKAAYQEKARQRIKRNRERFDKTRPSFRQRGYSARWDKAARNFVHFNPLCVFCNKVGITKASQEVDHIIPHKGDYNLMWDSENWQALCKPCHSKKTRRENHEKDSYRTAEC